MTTACHDCRFLLRHPDDPTGRFGCRKGAMRADLSVDWQPGDVATEDGVRWYRIAVADLTPRACPSFRVRGEDTPTDESGEPEGGDTTYIEDLPPDEEPATDTTEPPEADGADPVGTSSPTWSEPTYTAGVTDPAGYKAALRRRQRAKRKARTAPMFRCPVCGRLSPGVTLAGQPRRGCPDPRCRGSRGKAWGRQRQGLSAATVAAIREAHAAGQAGYRRLAEAYGCDRTTVRDIVTGRTHRGTPSPLPPGQVLPKGGGGRGCRAVRSSPSDNPLKSFDRGDDGED